MTLHKLRKTQILYSYYVLLIFTNDRIKQKVKSKVKAKTMCSKKIETVIRKIRKVERDDYTNCILKKQLAMRKRSMLFIKHLITIVSRLLLKMIDLYRLLPLDGR